MFGLLIGPITNLIGTIVDRIFPDATKAAELKAQVAQAMLKGEYDTELAEINAVNATMQAEAKSEHWAQWLWRPVIGFTFAAVVVNNVILVPYMHKLGVVAIPVPDQVWTAMLVILGASAAGRSFEKCYRNGNGK